MSSSAPGPCAVLFTGALPAGGACRALLASCTIPHVMRVGTTNSRRLMWSPAAAAAAAAAVTHTCPSTVLPPLGPADLDGTCVHYDVHEFARVEEEPTSAGLYPATSLDGVQRTLLLRLPPSTSGAPASSTGPQTWPPEAAPQLPSFMAKIEMFTLHHQVRLCPACLPMQAHRASSPWRRSACMPRCASWA